MGGTDGLGGLQGKKKQYPTVLVPCITCGAKFKRLTGAKYCKPCSSQADLDRRIAAQRKKQKERDGNE